MLSSFEKWNKENRKAIEMQRLLHRTRETSKYSVLQNLKFRCEINLQMVLLSRKTRKLHEQVAVKSSETKWRYFQYIHHLQQERDAVSGQDSQKVILTLQPEWLHMQQVYAVSVRLSFADFGVIVKIFIEEMEEFNYLVWTSIILRKARGVHTTLQGNFYRHRFKQNIPIEHCSNCLASVKLPNDSFLGMSGPNHNTEKMQDARIARMRGTAKCRFSFPQMYYFSLLKKPWREKYTSCENKSFPTSIAPASSCYSSKAFENI